MSMCLSIVNLLCANVIISAPDSFPREGKESPGSAAVLCHPLNVNFIDYEYAAQGITRETAHS